TITHDDATAMRRKCVDKIFFAGTSLTEMADYVHKNYGKPVKTRARARSRDIELARKLTEIEDRFCNKKKRSTSNKKIRDSKFEIRNSRRARVIGFTGPGGAGKTTLIDELVLRILHRDPKGRIAILSHDPSVVGEGALLG